MIKQKIIKFLIENKVLVTPEIIEKIPDEGFNISLFYEKVLEHKDHITEELLLTIINDIIDTSLSIIDSSKVLDYEEEIEGRLKKFNIKLVENYIKDASKKDFKDFVSHYNKRFDYLSSILKNRAELEGVASISRLKNNFSSNKNSDTEQTKEKVAIIGMILEKGETKNGHTMLTIEDKSGQIKALISKKNEELQALSRDLMLDEVIGIVGSAGDDIIFCESILFPDVPMSKPFKKSPEENYAVFISDTHIGSKMFKRKEFLKFIDWLNGEVGDENQKQISKKVKYLFIVGDLIEGIGIFPSQEQDVLIKDIYKQYEEACNILKLIRNDVCIIITPGNHDPMRIAEPQPMHYKDYAKKLYDMNNIVFVSSPSYLTINKTDNFEGIDILLYHGFSIPFYADSVPSIRKAGGQKRVDLVLNYLLQRRHLSPTHASTQFVPDPERDALVISRVPDIFATGHIHRVSVSNYKNVSCFNCSCWLSLTDYQVKNGIESQPCRAILVNLQTRANNILKFGYDENEEEYKNKKASN
jgi:DNA polymerase II small subunit